mmetsp:Transcript_10273/g.26987  ORF Transcript_10273/g.26987 Transcript_10273/m.26987 type:complete len:397 (-) Transcript_10273:1063-2253(-)
MFSARALMSATVSADRPSPRRSRPTVSIRANRLRVARSPVDTTSRPPPKQQRVSKPLASSLPCSFLTAACLESNIAIIEFGERRSEMIRMKDACIGRRSNNGRKRFVVHVTKLDEFLHPLGLESPLQITDGVWGPWPAREPTFLEPMPEPRDEHVRQNTVAILPWLTLRFSVNNMYHALEDLLAQYVPLVTTVREAQRLRAGTQPVVYMRQNLCRHASTGSCTSHVCSLNTSECALEMRLAERLTRIFDIKQLSGDTVCFDEIWLPTNRQVFSGGGQHGGGGVTKYETCELGQVDSVLEWQQDLGVPVLDVCVDVPHVTIIERLESRHITNLQAVTKVLEARGWHVEVVNLEKMSIDEQFAAMRKTTTLLGYHGAGLSWAQLLPPDTAEIQVPSTI